MRSKKAQKAPPVASSSTSNSLSDRWKRLTPDEKAQYVDKLGRPNFLKFKHRTEAEYTRVRDGAKSSKAGTKATPPSASQAGVVNGPELEQLLQAFPGTEKMFGVLMNHLKVLATAARPPTLAHGPPSTPKKSPRPLAENRSRTEEVYDSRTVPEHEATQYDQDLYNDIDKFLKHMDKTPRQFRKALKEKFPFVLERLKDDLKRYKELNSNAQLSPMPRQATF